MWALLSNPIMRAPNSTLYPELRVTFVICVLQLICHPMPPLNFTSPERRLQCSRTVNGSVARCPFIAECKERLEGNVI